MNATIELGSGDSGLTITAAPGAAGKVVVSGGVPLVDPVWVRSTRGGNREWYKNFLPSTRLIASSSSSRTSKKWRFLYMDESCRGACLMIAISACINVITIGTVPSIMA